MKTFFYVIEWDDGSGKTSGLIEAHDAQEVFDELRKITHEMSPSFRQEQVGVVVVFNQVGGYRD